MGCEISHENIKCGRCVNTINTRLPEDQRTAGVTVDVGRGQVGIDGDTATRDAVAQRLAGPGYPETGSVEGLHAAANAKSFVGCAIGRIVYAKGDRTD